MRSSDYSRLKTVRNNDNSGLDRTKTLVLLYKHFNMFMDNTYFLEYVIKANLECNKFALCEQTNNLIRNNFNISSNPG